MGRGGARWKLDAGCVESGPERRDRAGVDARVHEERQEVVSRRHLDVVRYVACRCGSSRPKPIEPRPGRARRRESAVASWHDDHLMPGALLWGGGAIASAGPGLRGPAVLAGAPAWPLPPRGNHARVGAGRVRDRRTRSPATRSRQASSTVPPQRTTGEEEERAGITGQRSSRRPRGVLTAAQVPAVPSSRPVRHLLGGAMHHSRDPTR